MSQLADNRRRATLPSLLDKMSLKALTSFISEATKDLDLAYIISAFIEAGMTSVVDFDVNAELEGGKIKSVFEPNGSSLAQRVHQLRPSNELQRISSDSSAQSICSQRLHEYFRVQESLTSFPRLQKSSFLFWRRRVTKGKHRSLHGKSLPLPQSHPVQNTPGWLTRSRSRSII